MKLFGLISLTLVASSSFASTVWYNGDDDGMGGYAALSGTPNGQGNSEFRQTEDFIWDSSSSATFVMGTMVATSSFTQLKWEIRDNGNIFMNQIGNVIASGTANAQLDSLGSWDLNPSFTKFAMTADIGSVALENGHYYFLDMAIVVPNASFTGGFTTTSGANSIGSPINNGNSFTLNPNDSFNVNFVDLSMGIGTNAVPEPASLAVLGLGALALVRRRKSK